MALPVILISSSSGSDTQASGAGPATALFGTTDASTDGTGLVVTLTAGTDLTNVATDGSHVIFLNDSTAGARNFGKITGKAGSGGATPNVTVASAFGLSLSGKSWAIGGKRASIGSTTSIKLFENNSSAGDAMPGWIIEMQSGHTEIIAATLTFRRAGDTTNGGIELRGVLGAATMPVLTFSNNGAAILSAVAFTTIRDFELRNSNATKTASYAFGLEFVNQTLFVIGLRITHATNKFWRIHSSNQGGLYVEGCEFANTASSGFVLGNAAYTAVFVANYIHDIGGDGISWGVGFGGDNSVTLIGNIFARCAGHGCSTVGIGSITSGTYDPIKCGVITGNTFDSNTGDGLRFATGGALSQPIHNNIFSNNGGYGINFVGATDAGLAATGIRLRNNVFDGNTSGSTNPTLTISQLDSQNVDPDYVNAAAGDFTPQEPTLEGTAFPTSIP